MTPQQTAISKSCSGTSYINLKLYEL